MTENIWVLASRNQGKAVEFEALLKQHAIKILTLDEIGFKESIDETGSTFEKNSALKARAVQPYSDYPVLADDSGLEVESLAGAPGVYSARFAGEGATDEENIQKLLSQLTNQKNRAARFVCCLTLIDLTGKLKSFMAACDGSISLTSHGHQGFGYDPVFIPEGYEKTLGELGESIKNKMSHRTLAVEKLALELF